MRIRAPRLFTGLDRDYRHDVVVAIGEDGMVAAVEQGGGPGGSGGPGGLTVIPGMVDAHIHLSLSCDPFEGWRNDLSDAHYALEARANGLKHLHRGITTVRDLGGIRDVVPILAQRVRAGLDEGPRIYTAGQWLCPTAGHGAIYGATASGAGEFREAVRRLFAKHADVVKVMATAGGLIEEGHDPNTTQITVDEADAIAEVSKLLKLPIAVHAHAADGIDLAIRMGARSIEHCTWVTDTQAAALQRDGVVVVPTIYTYERSAALRGDEHLFGEDEIRLSLRILEAKREGFAHLRAHGVTLAGGTDAGAPDTEHGCLPDEARCLLDWGLSPVEVLQSITLHAGELVAPGLAGRITEGSFGDLVVLDGDPLIDFDAIDRVVAVVKGGRLVHGELPDELLVP